MPSTTNILISQLRTVGLESLKGDLVSDNTIMTTVPYGTGFVGGVGAWQEEEPGACSAVQTSHSFLPLPEEISADSLASGSYS